VDAETVDQRKLGPGDAQGTGARHEDVANAVGKPPVAVVIAGSVMLPLAPRFWIVIVPRLDGWNPAADHAASCPSTTWSGVAVSDGLNSGPTAYLVVCVALDPDDLVVGNLDPQFVPPLAAMQPETVRVELEPTVDGDAAIPPEHRIARHAHKLARIDRDDIRANH
jgi:hypothetical protein